MSQSRHQEMIQEEQQNTINQEAINNKNEIQRESQCIDIIEVNQVKIEQRAKDLEKGQKQSQTSFDTVSSVSILDNNEIWDCITQSKQLKTISKDYTLMNPNTKQEEVKAFSNTNKLIGFTILTITVTIVLSLVSTMTLEWHWWTLLLVLGIVISKNNHRQLQQTREQEINRLQQEAQQYQKQEFDTEVQQEKQYVSVINQIRRYSKYLFNQIDTEQSMKYMNKIQKEITEQLLSNKFMFERYKKEYFISFEEYQKQGYRNKIRIIKEVISTKLIVFKILMNNNQAKEGSSFEDQIEFLQCLELTNHISIIANLHGQNTSSNEVKEMFINFINCNNQELPKLVQKIQLLYSQLLKSFQDYTLLKKFRELMDLKSTQQFEQPEIERKQITEKRVLQNTNPNLQQKYIDEDDIPCSFSEDIEDEIQEENQQNLQTVDEDFQYISQLLALPESEWEKALEQDYIQVFRKKETEGALFMIKSFVNLPNIPKEVAFNAVTDLEIRRKWDYILAKMDIIEDDKENNVQIFHYFIPTPPFVSKREAVIRKKQLKDFPNKNDWTIHHKSTEHPQIPESNKAIRVDLKINGMVFEDAEDINGCRIKWVIQNDIKGSVPKSIINSRSIKNPKIMMDSLIKACHQIMKGTY